MPPPKPVVPVNPRAPLRPEQVALVMEHPDVAAAVRELVVARMTAVAPVVAEAAVLAAAPGLAQAGADAVTSQTPAPRGDLHAMLAFADAATDRAHALDGECPCRPSRYVEVTGPGAPGRTVWAHRQRVGFGTPRPRP